MEDWLETMVVTEVIALVEDLLATPVVDVRP
jgi:hypothetical protein